MLVSKLAALTTVAAFSAVMPAQVASATAAPSPALHPTPGSLDVTFGQSGHIVEDFGADAFVESVAVMASGDVSVVGVANNQIEVLRLTGAGQPDPTFGSGGMVSTLVGAASAAYAQAFLPNGDLLVGGMEAVAGGSREMLLAAFLPNGTLDPAFGTAGLATASFVGSGFIDALAVQTDGKIVGAGYLNGQAAVVRFTASGSLDTSFGSGGLATTPGTTAVAVGIQHSGKIVTADQNNGRPTVARLTTSGTLDSTFGTSGVASAPFASTADPYGLAVQANGDVVLGGTESGTPQTFALARFTTTGHLDPTFGNAGLVSGQLGGAIMAMTLQPNGRILAAGGNATGSEFLVASYLTNGAPDTSFGTGGAASYSFGANDSARAIALQPDGKIILGGFTPVAAHYDFALVRMIGRSPTLNLNPTSGTPGSAITITGAGFGSNEDITVRFNTTVIGTTASDVLGRVSVELNVPIAAAQGTATVRATGVTTNLVGTQHYVVTA